MTDILTPVQRRKNMQQIRARDTKPEMLIRRGLHALGLRYRLHVKELPGCPDLVFPRYKVAVFINGCFWHAHGCSRSKVPQSRRDFWQDKLAATVTRDRLAIESLIAAEWRVLVIWECAMRGRLRVPDKLLFKSAVDFIKGGFNTFQDIKGGPLYPFSA